MFCHTARYHVNSKKWAGEGCKRYTPTEIGAQTESIQLSKEQKNFYKIDVYRKLVTIHRLDK